jgi:hypothetical protein
MIDMHEEIPNVGAGRSVPVGAVIHDLTEVVEAGDGPGEPAWDGMAVRRSEGQAESSPGRAVPGDPQEDARASGRVPPEDARIIDLMDAVEEGARDPAETDALREAVLRRAEAAAEAIARQIVPALAERLIREGFPPIAERLIREEIEKLKRASEAWE